MLHRILLLLSSSLGLLSSPEKSNTKTYQISTGEIDVERLSILNDLYNPDSLPFLQLSSGMEVLTVGCGIGLLEQKIAQQIGPTGSVIATDICPKQLVLARQYAAEEGINNLHFQEMDIANINQIPGQFDRVHCRFVLTHIPWVAVEKVLPLLLSKVKPSGALILEEIPNWQSPICEPSSKGYDAWKYFVSKMFEVQGTDVHIGETLYDFLKNQGYEIQYRTHQPVATNKRLKSLFRLGLRSMTSFLLKHQFATEAEIQQAMEELKSMEEDPHSFPRSWETSQLFITRPPL